MLYGFWWSWSLLLGLLFAVFTFFLLNYQVKIQLFLMALPLCVFPIPTYEKGFIIHL